MTPGTLAHIETGFQRRVDYYFQTFPRGAEAFRLKADHTRRVRDNAERIAASLGLGEGDRNLARAAAVLHDLGRFPQYARYGTFRDAVSVNHARIGVREAALGGILAGVDIRTKRLLARAVAWHNVPVLPPSGDVRSLFFTRLVRDADKLDIWKVALDNYRGTGRPNWLLRDLGLADRPGCSLSVVADLQRGRLLRLHALRTLDDFKLMQISWVYDLNFPCSFRMLTERGFLEQIAALLPPDPAVASAVDAARRHATARAQEGRAAIHIP